MKNKGFTLIELMIVVAIIGILAMIAMPSYQDYTKRTYVTEGILLASPVKNAVLEYYTTKGRLPESTSDLGMSFQINGGLQVVPLGGKMATSFALYHKVIYVYFDPKLQEHRTNKTKEVEFPIAPIINSGSIQWVCGDAAVRKYGSKGDYTGTGDSDIWVSTALGTNSVRSKYMPQVCR